MTRKPEKLSESFDPNVDRNPTLDRVIAKLQDADFPYEGQVARVEIWLNPSGDASCRVWGVRADDPEIMYWEPGF